MVAFQFDQLQTLLALIDEGTFEAAARRLHITASAVSQRVKALEQSSGQILVQRSNPVVPTEAGTIVLRLARQVALLDADAENALRGDGPANGAFSLAVAVNSDSLATWFLDSTAELAREARVVFDIYREDQEHTTSLLRSGTVLAAVTSTSDAVQGCTVEPLGAMRYRAVCTPRFDREWRVLDDPAALARAPRVDFDRRDDLQSAFLRELAVSEPSGAGAGAGVVRHYIPTSTDFARAVLLGYGWALLPEQQCVDELRAEELVELAPGRYTEVKLYWQRWNLVSPMLDSLSDAVKRGARSSLHAFTLDGSR